MRRELSDRTKAFALRIVRLSAALPRTREADVIGRQVLRSGTSPGAQCREAYRSRSKAELISKLESSLQELDETSYWLELLVESEIVSQTKLAPLMTEADELTRVMVAAVRTLKRGG
ncbi:MAG TPA: four helix bundle protein [Thermoanaerobaculia bacterium]|nr:four helix bundle protein [Thermoanaerobaculia bacterium]